MANGFQVDSVPARYGNSDLQRLTVAAGVGRRQTAVTPVPISGGAGVGNSFDGGTIDDCRGFAETVRAEARRLGCAVSKVSVNNPLPLYGGSAQVSFVCEAPADQAIHAIAELDRVILSLEPEAGK